MYVHCISSFSSLLFCLLYSVHSIFIIVLYVFIDVCAFDTYNKRILPYLLTRTVVREFARIDNASQWIMDNREIITMMSEFL